jgi:NNP family nitrate/nitrite transporter-like MFS transporter
MDNIAGVESSPREQFSVLRHAHVWVLSLLYVGTFGSFIGYSAAMPLLIKVNFWRQPVPTVVGIGINFAFYAFLGALIGSLVRPIGGRLADRFGGARVTVVSFVGMAVSTGLVLLSLSRLSALPAPLTPDQLKTFDASTWPNPALKALVDGNAHHFAFFLTSFLLVFVFSGIGNGSVYKMIPAIFRRDAVADTAEGSPERELALHGAAKKASSAVGIIGAVGAIGGFLIPITFNSPWVSDPLAATKSAFWIFTAFYLVCAAVTVGVYLRRKGTYAGI